MGSGGFGKKGGSPAVGSGFKGMKPKKKMTAGKQLKAMKGEC